MSRHGDLFAIDVGVNGMGWARWTNGYKDRSLRAPDLCGTYEMESKYLKEPFAFRADLIMCHLVVGPLSFGGFPRIQAMEWPEFRAGSAVGHAAAAGDSLSMLAFMCGQHCRQGTLMNAENILVAVSEWKGQLPKDLVERRLSAAVGSAAGDGTKIKSHAWDAVGIGLHWLGHSVKTMTTDDGRRTVFVRRRK